MRGLGGGGGGGRGEGGEIHWESYSTWGMRDDIRWFHGGTCVFGRSLNRHGALGAYKERGVGLDKCQ